MNIKARNIAKFFLKKNVELTEKQLQKLTYYAYVWYLVKFRQKLFNESPQAWIHGPVFMSLYKDIKNDHLKNAEDIDLERNKDIKLILEVVDKHYGKYSGNELERLTHSEKPWRKAREGLSATEKSQNKISDEDIIEYYSA